MDLNTDFIKEVVILSFSIRIKELRREKHISQEELGKRFDVTKQTVSNWENGISMPSYETLIGLADLFSVDMNFLLAYQPHRAGKIRETEKAFQIPIYDLSEFKLELDASLATRYEPMPESYINNGEYVVVTMNDDSMIGERIFKGSKLVVKKQQIFSSGDIVLVLHEEDSQEKFLVRKIKMVSEKIILFPAHYEYLQEDYSKKKMTIYGIVKYIGLREI